MADCRERVGGIGAKRHGLRHACSRGPLCLVVLWGMILVTAAAAQQREQSVRWGVDDAGSPGLLCRHPKAAELVEEFGFDLWVMHYAGPTSVAGNAAYIAEADAWCTENDVDWVANLEQSNWVESRIDDQGRDWFDQPDDLHYFLFPDELLDELGRCRRLLGLMYDEAAHTQGCRHKIAGLDRPMFFNPAGHTLDTASDAFASAVQQVADRHQEFGIPLFTEHVFPVMFHSFDRGGWTAATKILKENWSPAFIACAMGAALQYDTELWITPDLWGVGGYPSHSVEEYRSALLLAYHMGADCIYTENLAYDDENKGVGSLVLFDGDDYTVTDYGEVTKWFWHEYVPANPRPYSFRDVKPRVAIVRRPDACWGQSASWLPDYLFGCKEWQSTETTEAWLDIWHLLSRGVIPRESISWHNASLSDVPYQVFCPMDGVVVFDDRVGEEHLAGIDVIFLTGLGITQETQWAVARCVRAGATCIALPHLLPERVRRLAEDGGAIADGKGVWLATDDFLADEVRERVAHALPEEDEIRYRFGGSAVVLRPIDGDPNRLRAEVIEGEQR